MVTIQDVARAAGVSPMTVSNVLNHRGSVRAANRERVLAAISALDYQVNVAARNLRSGRTGTIGLAVPELDLPYTGQLAARIVRAGRRHGLRVVIEETGASKYREIDAIAQSRLRMYDGLIISAVGIGVADLEHLPLTGPVVLLGERIAGSMVDHVGMPNVEGARAVVEHLVRTGRRNIAVVGAPIGFHLDPHRVELEAARLRIRGYHEALAGAGIRPDPALIIETDEWSLAGGAAGAATLFGRGIPYDAVFCLTDSVALGALRQLADAGVRVPQDVAVVGFDNIVEAEYCVPRLTTVAPDHEQIAETALQLLVERIARGDEVGPGRDVTSSFRVVERESSGPGRAADAATATSSKKKVL